MERNRLVSREGLDMLRRVITDTHQFRAGQLAEAARTGLAIL